MSFFFAPFEEMNLCEYGSATLVRKMETQMNKYHGSKFEEYLKEKGASEKISVLAQKRWAELQTEEPETPSEITEDLPRGINRFFQWLRHAINNLVS